MITWVLMGVFTPIMIRIEVLFCIMNSSGGGGDHGAGGGCSVDCIIVDQKRG